MISRHVLMVEVRLINILSIFSSEYVACELVSLMLPREKGRSFGGAGIYSGLSTSPWKPREVSHRLWGLRTGVS